VTKVLERLSEVVETRVPGQVLDAASKTIAEEVGADCCSIFLLDPPGGGHHWRAVFGPWGLCYLLMRGPHGAARDALSEMR